MMLIFVFQQNGFSAGQLQTKNSLLLTVDIMIQISHNVLISPLHGLVSGKISCLGHQQKKAENSVSVVLFVVSILVSIHPAGRHNTQKLSCVDSMTAYISIS